MSAACIESEGCSPFTQPEGSRGFIGFGPPPGEWSTVDTSEPGERVALIVVQNATKRSTLLRQYARRGYNCVCCEPVLARSYQDLFHPRGGTTVVTDDFDLVLDLSLEPNDSKVWVHAVVEVCEIIGEAHAQSLGVDTIVPTFCSAYAYDDDWMDDSGSLA